MLVPVGLLGSLLTLLGVLVFLSTRDPSFAVEEDYYQKAAHWDERQQQQVANQELGWLASPRFEATALSTHLVVELKDGVGHGLRGALVAVEAFHNARAGDIFKSRLHETAPGSYRAELPSRRAGLWEVRVIAARGSERFTHSARIEMPARTESK